MSESVKFRRDCEGAGDFVIDAPRSDFKILQLTDMQSLDLSQAAVDTARPSQLKGAFFGDGIYDDELRTWRYVRELVERGKPDLIIVTGDVIYGETDDNGSMWDTVIDNFDSIGIPWSFCFGNHDNESMMGVKWQTERVKKSKLCIFERGSLTGNSNFSIVIERGGKPAFALYLLDTNGCHELANPGEGLDRDNPDYDKITQTGGIYPDQLQWFEKTAESVNVSAGKIIPSAAFFHIPTLAFYDSIAEKYGEPLSYPIETNLDGDFGAFRCDIRGEAVDRDYTFFNAAKKVGTVGMFCGHYHCSYSSVEWRDMRLTFGLKTGTAAFYEKLPMGGTLITLGLDCGKLEAEHIYQQYIV